MFPNNMTKIIISGLLGILLFWVLTGAALELKGSTNITLSGGGTNTYTYTPSGGGGSSGGGGGGGGISNEKFENIEVKEKYDRFIYKGKVTVYAFTNSSNPVLFVNITGNVNAGEINTAVEVLRNTSTLVKTPAPGLVYKNLNIWVGTSGFAVPKNIMKAEIEFRVDNSWISDNDLDSEDIKLVRWDKTLWVQLKTIEKNRDSMNTYFVAETDSFSSFAITGLKGTPVPTPAFQTGGPDKSGEETSTPPEQAEKSAGFEFLLTAIIAGAVYLVLRKAG
jgi:PGF-pre-PGF domain-containing protein